MTADAAAPEVAGEREDQPPAGDSGTTRRRRRVVVRTLAALLVALVLAGGWLTYQVYRAGTALTAAQGKVTALRASVDDGDLSAVMDALPGLRADLGRARSASSDPVWTAALVVPWLGDQLGAVRTVSVALDDIVEAGLPLLSAVDEALTASPDDSGGIDLAPLVAAVPEFVAAAGDVSRSSGALLALDTGGLLDRLAGPIEELGGWLPPMRDALAAAARTAVVLPTMLGADEPRTYLVALLNSAELRAQGGIVGAIAVVHADDARIALGAQAAGSAFPGLDRSVLELTDDELTLQTDRLGRYVQDATLTPEFPRAAQLLAARWTHETGEEVDGVIALDPTVMAGMLRGTGPITAAGERLDADSAVRVLLSDTYARLSDPESTDTFFADVAASVFGAVAAGQGDRVRVTAEMARAADAGRLRVWSAHEREEAVLADERIGGAFLTGPFEDTVGVFLDEGTVSKLDYYLHTKVGVEDVACTAGQGTATVRLDLRYDPPGDGTGLPAYVLGGAPDGLPLGWLQTNISFYAPAGAPMDTIRLGDAWVGGETGETAGRAVHRVTARMAPGDELTYRVEVPVRDEELGVWSTPTLTSPGWLTAACTTG